jgi:enoyl-[acyl-carrier protein] reductase II
MTGDVTPAGPPHRTTRITRLFGIRYPVVQAGMVWTAGAKLAVAVSGAGALGTIGAGSMKPDLLRAQIRKARAATSAPVAVNIPLLRADAEDLVRATIDEGIRIIITSAGHPGKFTPLLKQSGCVAVHVVANIKQAKKAEESGCDAVVAEGFEAGGHNGVDELTSFVLVPQVCDAVKLPVIAAGGIVDGRGVAAAFALGAEGVQVGTRFAATIESSAHDLYKKAIIESGDTGTVMAMRGLTPVRLLKTPFAKRAVDAERRGASKEELAELLGRKREMQGIFEGNLDEGELEAGEGAGMIKEVLPAAEVVKRLVEEYERVVRGLENF